jgi:hypothetical protein
MPKFSLYINIIEHVWISIGTAPSFLTSALNGSGQVQALASLLPGETAPVGDRVGPRCCLLQTKIRFRRQELNPGCQAT